MRSSVWHAALLILLLGPATVAAQHNAGVILEPPARSYTRQLSSLSDAIVNTICGLDGWQAVLLHPASSLLQAAEVQQDFARLIAHAPGFDPAKLAQELDLSDILVVRIVIAEDADITEKVRLDTRWCQAGQKVIRGFEILMSDLGPGDIRTAADGFAAHLVEGFEAAQPVKLPADTTPTPATDTPAIAAPVTDTAPAPTDRPAAATDAPVVPDKPPAVADKPAAVADIPAPATKEASVPSTEASAEHVAAARAALALGDLDLARRETDLAFKYGEPLLWVYLLRAEFAAAENNAEDQRKWLQRAAKVDAGAMEPLLRLAALFHTEGLWQKAIETYEEAIAIDPDCVAAYVGAAAVLSSHNRPKQAATYLDEVVARNPQDNSLLMKLGDAYRQANMLAEAEEVYDLAARTAGPHLRSQIFDKLGDLYVSAGQFEEGFYCYAEAARLRGGRDHPLARKRYNQIMRTADEAVMASLESAIQVFDKYSRDRIVPREKAYLASEQASEQITEVAGFAKTVLPPAGTQRLHLQRQLFYNLALEASVNLMTYLDTNMELPLKQYKNAATEARAEFQQLRKLGEL